MTDIYDQFDRATGTISAYAILFEGKCVAKIVTKCGVSATAFVHWWGCEMVRGRATGGGYDRHSAAIQKAVEHMKNNALVPGLKHYRLEAYEMAERSGFVRALEQTETDQPSSWDRRLRDQGFEIATII